MRVWAAPGFVAAFFTLASFVSAFAAVPGQIVADPAAPEWLERTDGSPVFLCGPGDPEEFLYLGDRQPDGTRSGNEQGQIIQRLAAQGGNVLYLQVVRTNGGDGSLDLNNPFVDADPALGFDEEILAQWDGWLQQMDDAGIAPFFIFYDDGACIWGCNPDTDDAVPPEEQLFLETLVNRYENLKNIIWVLAEEYGERYSVARAANMAAVIGAADDHDHPIANTQNTGLAFDHATDANLDVFGLQCPVSCDLSTPPVVINDLINTAFTNAAGLHNVTMVEIAFGGAGTGDRARQVMWAVAMGGAYMLVNGWDLTGPTDPPDSNLNECRHLQQFMERTRLEDLGPDDSRGLTDTSYALVDDAGGNFVLYTTAYSAGLGISQLPAGDYSVEWLDTVTGATEVEAHIQAAVGDVTFLRPAALAGATELAVYLESCNDADGDGFCGDADNCPGVNNPDQADVDGDGMGDPCDACPVCPQNDVDADGLCCDVDNCPLDANPGQEDVDADGAGDPCDNCPGLPNPSQSDLDDDGPGDACDPCPLDPLDDQDGDGLCAEADNCPVDANPGQSDADGDGRGDACDPGVLLTEVLYDQDTGEQEFVEFLAAERQIDVTGWTLSDLDEVTFTLSSADGRFGCAEPFVLDPGDRVVVFQGSGTEVCSGTVRELYLAGGTFLQRSGDQVLLRDAEGDCVDYAVFETGTAVDPQPSDCDWTGGPTSNGNVFGVSISRLDLPPVDTDADDDWEASGAALTTGPATPGSANVVLQDADGDGVGDGADNCVATFNPGQDDHDNDDEGDLCDTDDGRTTLRIGAAGVIDWDAEAGADGWNLYRGDLAILRGSGLYTQAPGSNPLAAADCGLPTPGAVGAETIPSGTAVFYLTSSVAAGVEGGIGFDSGGAPRPNANPCP